jgi:hypothetical protein
VVHQNGCYELTSFELTNRYDPEQVLILEKFNDQHIVSAVYVDGASKLSYVKRFRIETSSIDKMFSFISDTKGSRLQYVSVQDKPIVELSLQKKRSKEKVDIDLSEAIDVKGWKSIGKRISTHRVVKIADRTNAAAATDAPAGASAASEVENLKKEVAADRAELKKKKPGKTDAKVKKDSKAKAKEKPRDPGPSSPAPKQTDQGKSVKNRDDGDAEDHGENTFHIGDTVEFNIPPKKENGQDDQLDLFKRDQ